MKKINVKQYQLILIVLSLLYMLPLSVISFFNRPSADDFNYSWRTFQTLQSGGGLFALLKSAFETTIYYWHNWQGLYTSAFVLSLQPGIFGSSFYALTGLLMLMLLIGSTLYAACYIVKYVLDGTLLDGMTLGCLMSFMMIQFMPSCVEGLFWFNGTMNYGLFYALMLLLLVTGIKTAQADRIGIRCAIASVLLGFLLEGGNHVTAFMSLILMVLFIAYGLLSGKRKAVLLYTVTLAVMVCCFLLNILSPGTKIRRSGLSGPGILSSIFLSIRHGCQLINNSITLTLILVLILALPIFSALASRLRARTGFRFRFPLLVLIGSIGWICAMFCPPLYAMGNPGAGRLYDVVYYFFILLTFVNVFYICGWICCRVEERSLPAFPDSGYSPAVFLLLLALLFVLALDSWSMEACKSLLSGEAVTYCREADARYGMCIEGKGDDIELPPFSALPEILFFSDIANDPNDWSNTALARYFELHSVRVTSP